MSSSGSSGSKGGQGKGGGDDKYVLLNCDDHQRVLARMGRDIAEARPDITHQVRREVCVCVRVSIRAMLIYLTA